MNRSATVLHYGDPYSIAIRPFATTVMWIVRNCSCQRFPLWAWMPAERSSSPTIRPSPTSPYCWSVLFTTRHPETFGMQTILCQCRAVVGAPLLATSKRCACRVTARRLHPSTMYSPDWNVACQRAVRHTVTAAQWTSCFVIFPRVEWYPLLPLAAFANKKHKNDKKFAPEFCGVF